MSLHIGGQKIAAISGPVRERNKYEISCGYSSRDS